MFWVRLIIITGIFSLPFQWFTLASIGGLGLKPSNAIIPLYIAIFLFNSRARINLTTLFRTSIFVQIYSLYLILFSISLLWAEDLVGGAVFLSKHVLYFIYFVTFYALLSINDFKTLRSSINVGSMIAVLLFLSVIAFIFMLIGRNLFVELISILSTGNATSLQFILNPVFNYSVSGESSVEFEASLRNTLIGSFILYLVLSIINAQNKISLREGIVVVISLGIVLLSLSRANILALAIIGVLFTILRKYNSKTLLKLFIIGVPILTVLVLIMYPLVDMVLGRIVDLTDDSRFDIYRIAIEAINESSILGYGVGARVHFFIWDTQMHNIFLNSWFQTGILGLLLSISYYSALAYEAFRITQTNSKIYSHDTILLMALLVVVPLFRCLVSASGLFTLIEWTFLSFFYYYRFLVMKEERVLG